MTPFEQEQLNKFENDLYSQRSLTDENFKEYLLFSFKKTLEESLQEQAQAIINELESNPNEDGSISPNLQHFIENKQSQLKKKFIN